MVAPERAPAGFWLRYAAWSLDAVCLLPLVAVLALAPMRAALAQAAGALRALTAAMAQVLDGAVAQAQSPFAMTLSLLADPRLNVGVNRLSEALTTLLVVPPLLYAVLACVWTLAFECGSWQATPGKRALGLIVSGADGQRLRQPQALARFGAAGLSWLTLNLGHAMVLLPPHLALHDRLSHTRVLADPARSALPTWARAWLLLQALVTVVACAWLVVALRDWMQALLQQALSGL